MRPKWLHLGSILMIAAALAVSPAQATKYNFTALPTAFANGISDNGTVVYGTFHGISPNGLVTVTGAYPNWSNGVNDGGLTVGSGPNSYGSNGYLYDGSSYTTITATIGGHLYSSAMDARGINDSGQIVGFYLGTDGVYHGYLGTTTTIGGTFASISDPLAGASGTFAIGINASGVIAGFYFDSAGVSHGFVDNNGVFTTVDYGANTIITGINDNGTLVGYLNNGSGPSFKATPVPAHPSAILLLLLLD